VILFNCSARKQQRSYFSANFQDSLGKPAPECQTTACQTIIHFTAAGDDGDGGGDTQTLKTSKAPIKSPPYSFLRPGGLPVVQPTYFALT